ncbi:hypothetical protein OG21DRAFT_1483783 [Imleria badia]|nr:hypothetical protein OG21DRAFT_1483783 [Imleria badia]
MGEGVEGGGGPGEGDGGRIGGERDRSAGADGNEEDEDEDCEEEADGEDGLEPNWEVLDYWAMRFRPLWTASESKDADKKTKTDAEEDTRSSETSTSADADAVHTNAQQDVIVLVCNRFGRERGKTFAGSSAIFAMRPSSGKPRLLRVMGEREEGVNEYHSPSGVTIDDHGLGTPFEDIIRYSSSAPLAGSYVPWSPVPRIDMSTLEPMSPRCRSMPYWYDTFNV